MAASVRGSPVAACSRWASLAPLLPVPGLSVSWALDRVRESGAVECLRGAHETALLAAVFGLHE
eukprot:4703557-Lingulodinium_polyedra.AAC.1